MSTTSCIDYYRRNRRVIEALTFSRCIKPVKSVSPRGLANFLSSNGDVQMLEQRLGNFNVFAALGVTEKEIRHSRILRWLFDPQGSHARGTAFLQSFLKLITNDPDILNAEVLSGFVCDCENDRTDILLLNHAQRILCVVENKVRISQSSEQLKTYRKRIEIRFPDYQRHFVFLTLRREKPLDREWMPLDYHALLTALRPPVKRVNTSRATALSMLFAHYADAIQNRGNRSSGLNILDILHLTTHELKHSDFLAWLLRAGETHGLGEEFIRYLLELLCERGANIPGEAIKGSGDFQVRREEEDIDIFLLSENHRLVVAIENKILSREHRDQLERYRKLLGKYYSEERIVHVFLDLKQEKPKSADYIPISYNDLLPFFTTAEKQLCSDRLSPQDQTAILLEHYWDLLEHHLWIKEKTIITPPPGIVEVCEKISKESSREVSHLLYSIKTWQKELAVGLEEFLYACADRYFGTTLKATWQLWYTFIPAAFDQFQQLRESGSDAGAKGRLARYEFFVIPFGDSATVRKPGIYLDFKLLNSKEGYEPLKWRLHKSALRDPILFNRVRGTLKLPKFDILLNYKLCSFDEAVALPLDELKKRIERRISRFAKSFHVEIVAWFTHELKEGQGGLQRKPR